jgi:hypothetical protein
MTEDQVRALLRAECDKAGSIRAWARKHDLSAMYVSKVLRGQQAPGPSICRPLGLIREIREIPYGTLLAQGVPGVAGEVVKRQPPAASWNTAPVQFHSGHCPSSVV